MWKIATINVDGLDEMAWFVVREWMLEVGVDALAVQEHKLLLSGGGPSEGDDTFMTFMGEAGAGRSGDLAGGWGGLCGESGWKGLVSRCSKRCRGR